MIVLGLTGSIAMGKSETARMFAQRGIPVFDSDASVHQLYEKDGAAVAEIGKIVPACIVDGKVDRAILANQVKENPELLAKIEQAVHPLVRAQQADFLTSASSAGAWAAVLDIPLLFETGHEKDVDRILVVSTSPEIQRKRALDRPGMTPEKLDFILARQVPDTIKKAKADYVIDTSISLEDTAMQVDRIIAELRQMERH
jgi:dephospho-CoA kinase